MATITRDPMHPAPAALQDETLIATFRANPAAYWRAHGIMALSGGVVAGIVLLALGNAHPWVGPLAAVLAIGLRAAFLRSEALEEDWRLTSSRLLGHGGRIVSLREVATARKFLDAVQIVTKDGDKHLIRYQADPGAVAAAILAARDTRR